MGSDSVHDTDQLAGQICLYIFENYHRSLPLSEVSEVINKSERSTRRLIIIRIGYPFSKLKNAIRMYHTVAGFTGNRHELYDRAFRCGFRDENAFYYWWKRWAVVKKTDFKDKQVNFENAVNSECREIVNRINELIGYLEDRKGED